MSNTNAIPLITINEYDIENLNIINPIEFMSNEENKQLSETIKQRLKNSNNPKSWMTLEQCKDLVKEKFNL